MSSSLSRCSRTWVSLLGCATALLSPSAPADDFRVFDATLYEGKPDLSATGFEHLPVVYGQFLWSNWEDRTQRALPDAPAIRREMSQFNAGDMVVLDIEHWPIASEVSANERDANIEKFKYIADIVHHAVPGIKVGFYSMVPEPSYWAPVSEDEDQIKKWQKDNARLQSIANEVDAIFPHLYTYYADREGWVKAAKANIAEAHQYGKPIYPFLMMEYHDNGDPDVADKPIPPDFWKLQLETVKQAGADGVVIWGGYTDEWDEDARWWIETKKFVSSLAQTAGEPSPRSDLTAGAPGR